MLKYKLSLSGTILLTQFLFGQVGGLNIYEFLNLPASARITALGGNLISVRDDDANLAFNNPAALNQRMDGQISFNHNFHLAKIQNGYVNFTKHIDKWDVTLHGGLFYVDYGEIDETDVFGQNLGTLNVSEYAFSLGAGKVVNERLSIGANAKFITSNFAYYNSLGVVFDAAATYFDTASNFVATLLFKNMGTQISKYTEKEESLPFEIQLGISKRLRYLPFRVGIIYRYFDRWNILYDDPNIQETAILFTDQPTERSTSSIWFDNFFRHFVFNGEFLFGKKENFKLRFGYSHLTREELLVTNVGSFAGFSFGVGFKINRFKIDYGQSTYHTAGGPNHISITTYLREFK